jgi:hypothetical protein
MQRDDIIQLHQILSNRFDEEELRTLCFDLGFELEIAPGIGREYPVKVQS